MTELSIIIPVYYSENSITPLVDMLQVEIAKYINDFEVVLVNDGSKDKSGEHCAALAKKYSKNVVYAELARNFSEHNAVMAGLNICTGKYAVIIDDDFQNPPEEINKLYTKISSSDADVVYSKYVEKKHSLFRNLGSKFNDLVATYMLNKPQNLYLCSFKIIARTTINEIIKYKGPYPYIDGLILRATDKIETQVVEHQSRKEGRSNYTLKKLLRLWLNMFINFSLKPLRLSFFLGFFSAIVGFVLAIMFAIEKLQNPLMPMGWPSLIISIMLFSGIQLLILGLIGEFLGRLFLMNTGTPQYVIRKVLPENKINSK